MKKVSNSIIQQLQIVFSFSILLLFFSLLASYYSTQKLINNSELVNHTNEVLIEAEAIISHMKDAETGQRGFLITADPQFLTPYEGAYEKTTDSYNNLLELTADNPVQQKNLREVKALYEAKFGQMQNIIDMARKNSNFVEDTESRLREMIRGKKIMDDLRLSTDRIKEEESNVLKERLEQQQIYIKYTPILLVAAALISILITISSYLRIRTDIGKRLAQQQLDEEKYTETLRRIGHIERVTQRVSDGDYSARSTDETDDELGRISTALNAMAGSLEQTFSDLSIQNWLQAGEVQVNDAIRGERVLKKLASNLINTLAAYSGANLGTIYILDSDWKFSLAGSFAVQDAPQSVLVGHGLAGQVIVAKKPLLVRDLPDNYLKVKSSLGEASPEALAILPLVYSYECIGVVELGFLKAPEELTMRFLEENLETMASGVNSALDYVKLQNFLEETQAQAEELQTQHNELENLNAELEAQSQKLQASEEELRVQQEELQQTNGELEERSGLLEEKNLEILKKAEELELTTRYKSEFLANMSHELRTPLNSILLLSRLLAENDDKNLTSEQIEYATVIQSSGNGLLGLIDEILDLSKIEAGKMELDYVPVSVKEICDDMKGLFAPVAREKGLDFSVAIGNGVPPVIETDKMRMEQILKNLVSNALKFTSQGSVGITVKLQEGNDRMLCFVVRDTGIGVAPEKQQHIFEAFQQADGSTKRKYGGTGLGLSISRELAKLLGGEISLTSVVNEGSEFTLFVPIKPTYVAAEPETGNLFGVHQEEPASQAAPKVQSRFISTVIPESIPDDRALVTEADKTILIVEDDTFFAKSLLDYTRKQGYKGIVSVRGDEGLELARTFKPMGILLDIQLPVLSGWEVMDQLKNDPETRHIPVHIMSSHRMKNESLQKGAIDFIDKPVAIEKMDEIFRKIEYVISKKSKKVLIVEDNSMHAKALAYFLGTFEIHSELKSDIHEGIQALSGNEVDCVILDMGIPDKKAYDMLEEAKKNPGFEHIPIIIFTGKSLSMTEELRIKQYADSIIVKTAHSYQRMLDEVSLFLHVVEENKKNVRQNTEARKLGGLGEILNNKTVLIADDDVRNIFSLSKSLENYKMNVLTALDGKEALQKLQENPSVDVVLLDMMMPQMDGYETAKRIRENPQWRNLPVIAVTAKAMTGDREKCINAGASDYITKPVDIDQLMSLLRVWLYEKY
ncbi:response regulator [Dyadobacter fermentans]|uniref:histidine kinase n=1 Tax=Dyadobacter fermentans (strain ATCC 700827 / DSM 18053 / CIP 107007 / KCTC 52180 / NS114) TaxID=471854 RepID=C6VYI3_DYAFD|nr:response regulator [Dyadobacter fermentans]ACT91662.1 histidine kinase [Dyadobacter fermentans DSM 18053]